MRENMNKREQKSGRWMYQLMERQNEKHLWLLLAAWLQMRGWVAGQPTEHGWEPQAVGWAESCQSSACNQQNLPAAAVAKGPLRVPSSRTLVCVNEHWPTSLSVEQTSRVLLVTFTLWFYVLLLSLIYSLIIKLLNDKQCFTLSKGHIWRKFFLHQHTSWVTWQYPSFAWKILLQNVHQSWKLKQTLESKLPKCLVCPKTDFQHSNSCLALYITDLRVSWRQDSICAFQHRDCIFTASCLNSICQITMFSKKETVKRYFVYTFVYAQLHQHK